MVVRAVDPMQALQNFVDACGSQKAASVKLGCSPQFVNTILRGRKRVPDLMLHKLGLKRSVVTEK